ncbi:hypothetical protein M0R89_02470 [Halorussus limi]|uniref:Halobacterial output domain-containing protein n=1 Tax=Halorussus limi TaxID=2938695 RepID=A0A8U0HV63_9EURY|nr:HalOD1 output domain-containing protein [Halorussus limi]UPV74940.1 hypothetical protein M0R89_02470 [Halorussus limi]
MSEKQSAVRRKTLLTHELEADQTPSEGVVAAVSSASGTDPGAMEPLATSIDPDAVDALFADHYDGTARGTGLVQFSYAGYEVVVNGDGLVSVLDDS